MEEKTFKDRLTEELSYQGLTNRDFAQKIGISLGTLGMYLYRGSIPAADVAVKMAQVLNTTAEYLVLGTPTNEGSAGQRTKSDWQRKELASIASRLTAPQLEHFLAIARAYKEAVQPDEE